MDALRYAQLLSSRICHDLITPVGAIQSGFELLSSGSNAPDLLHLIHHSAETALRRLVYFRSAFGVSSASGFSNLDKVISLINDYCSPLHLSFVPSIFLPQPELVNFPLLGRTILNLTLSLMELASSGTHYGLDIQQQGPKLEMTATLEGALFDMSPDTQSALEGSLSESELTPQTVQPFMSGELIAQLGLKFDLLSSTRTLLRCKLTPLDQPQLYEATLF